MCGCLSFVYHFGLTPHCFVIVYVSVTVCYSSIICAAVLSNLSAFLPIVLSYLSALFLLSWNFYLAFGGFRCVNS